MGLNYKIHATRFKELGYINQGPGLWRFVDLSEGKTDPPRVVGSQYKTKAELLADLTRYAKESWNLPPETAATSPRDELLIDQSDATIEPLEVDSCEDCEVPATHKVMLDLRSEGSTIPVGHYCLPDAVKRLARVREGLPPPPGDEKPTYYCDECGNEEAGEDGLIGDHHATSCSMHPKNQV